MTSVPKCAILAAAVSVEFGCAPPLSRAGQESASAAVVCGAPTAEPDWASGDTVGILLTYVGALLESERSTFQVYQRTECRDCDDLFSLQREFFASSTSVLRRIAREQADDPRAQCAWGEALFRYAAIGEGDFDRAVLRQADSVLVRASELAQSDATLRRQIEELLINVRTFSR